jgi:competence protein ComEA
MPEISPYRVAAYAAMAAVLVLVGWNSLRSDDASERVSAVGASGGPGSSVVGARPTGSGGSGDAGGSGLQIGPGDRRIVVDVSGEVKRPGVYVFRHGQRVIDAIRRAGGPGKGAYAAGINRAALLADGQQVVVPSRIPGGGGGGPAGAAGVAGAPGSADAPISLGTATQAQLEEIEGIGPVTAQSILEFRDSQGGVSSVEDLDQVSGIGPVTMEALRSRLQP